MAQKIWKLENNLPPELPREQQIRYFQDLANGDPSARVILIEHNLRLVSSIVKTYFYKKKSEDLFNTGVIGLIYSIDRFDLSKNVEFSTFAIPVIMGTIKDYIKDNYKFYPMSLDSSMSAPNEDETDVLINVIPGESNTEETYLYDEIKEILRYIIENCLPEREKEAIKHYHGFYDNKPKTQAEIAKILGIDQTQVSKIIKRGLERIISELSNRELINEYDLYIKKVYKIKAKMKPNKEPVTIFTILNRHTRAQVKEMLTRLNDDERELNLLRWGEDLDHPSRSKDWTNEHQIKMNELYKKMRYLLEHPDKESAPVKKNLTKKDKTKVS